MEYPWEKKLKPQQEEMPEPSSPIHDIQPMEIKEPTQPIHEILPAVKSEPITKDNILKFLPIAEDEESQIPNANWFEDKQKEQVKIAHEIDVYDLPIKGAKEIEISASLMKTFWTKDFKGNDVELEICPRKVYIENILRMYNLTSEAQLRGLYFESGCYGKVAHGGDVITDLPRLKLKKVDKDRLRKSGVPTHQWVGEKGSEQRRIDLQIEHFHKKVKEYQLFLDDSNCQVQVKFKSKEGITVRSTMDIFPTTLLYQHDNGLILPSLANIDLKLTQNVDSTFGDFQWGDLNKVDMMQADLYNFMMRYIDYKLNPHLEDIIPRIAKKMLKEHNVLFLFWIFGFKAKDNLEQQFKQVSRGYDADIETYVIDKIKKTAGLLDMYAGMGWDALPKYDICRKCELSCANGGKCEQAKLNEQV